MRKKPEQTENSGGVDMLKICDYGSVAIKHNGVTNSVHLYVVDQERFSPTMEDAGRDILIS